MKTLLKNLINRIKKIFTKEETLESKIEKYVKEDMNSLKEKDVFEVLKLNIKNNSKDLLQLSNFKEYSLKLWQISEQASRPLLVMIMGEFKTGKSTFINAMLEEEILKSDVTPATAVVSMISYGEERKVLAHFRDGSTKEYSFEELKNITAEGDDSKKELRSNIKYVELFIPKEFLKSITIIDTPGLNVDNQLHIQATKEFMNEADMVFWVFAYGKAASRTEIAAISELSKRLKPMAIINRIDEIDEEEESLEEIIQEIKKRLKGHVEDVIGVSSYLAKKGILEKDNQALSESKWTDFSNKLEGDVLQKSEDLKIVSIVDKLKEYIEQLRKFIKESKSEAIKMEVKFTNTSQYKKDLLEDISRFKSLVKESIKMRQNKEQATINADYLYQCMQKNRESELDKVDIPMDYLLKIVDVLKKLKGTEKIINNINSYNSITDIVIEELKKVSARITQLNRTDKQLDEEYDQLKSEINNYKTSGIFGGAPLLDWSGKGKKLESWRQDFNNRVENLKGKYRQCEYDNQNQLARLTRRNAEIYAYLPKIDKVFELNIKKNEDEMANFEKAFKSEKEQYNSLKAEINKAEKVIQGLQNLVDMNSKRELSQEEAAAGVEYNIERF